MKPFLKWPGGKRWFVANHAEILPKTFNRYIEPFLGGGSVFVHLKPTQAILSDTNSELIATYEAIRDEWVALNKRLVAHKAKHEGDYYYTVRQSNPRLTVTNAARLIYLNRTCFNGIYRVNLKGEFNVHKGTKDAVVLETDDFESAAGLLVNADIQTSNFEMVIKNRIKYFLLCQR